MSDSPPRFVLASGTETFSQPIALRMNEIVSGVRSDLAIVGANGKYYQGTVLVNGEIWKAISDEAVEEGEQVVVKSVDGFKLRVKKIGS